VPGGDPVRDNERCETTARRYRKAAIRFATALEESTGPVHKFDFSLPAFDLVLKKVRAQHGRERIASEFVVVHLHEHVGEFGCAHADQIADPFSVRTQAHGEVSRLSAQKSVHFPPLRQRRWERLEGALAQLLQGVVALFHSEVGVERSSKFFFCAPAIVTKISPGVLAKAA